MTIPGSSTPLTDEDEHHSPARSNMPGHAEASAKRARPTLLSTCRTCPASKRAVEASMQRRRGQARSGYLRGRHGACPGSPSESCRAASRDGRPGFPARPSWHRYPARVHAPGDPKRGYLHSSPRAKERRLETPVGRYSVTEYHQQSRDCRQY